MFDSCICVDPDEVSQLLRRTKKTARKQHGCVECRRPIEPGQQYEEDVTLFDGVFSVYKTCLSCLRIRKSLFECGFYYGEMWSEIHYTFCGADEDGNEECVCPEADDV